MTCGREQTELSSLNYYFSESEWCLKFEIIMFHCTVKCFMLVFFQKQEGVLLTARDTIAVNQVSISLLFKGVWFLNNIVVDDNIKFYSMWHCLNMIAFFCDSAIDKNIFLHVLIFLFQTFDQLEALASSNELDEHHSKQNVLRHTKVIHLGPVK